MQQVAAAAAGLLIDGVVTALLREVAAALEEEPIATKHCCRGSWLNSTIQNDGGTFGSQCTRHDVRCRRVDNASAAASIALCQLPAGSLRCMRYGSQWSPRRRWRAHHSIQRPRCDCIMGRNRFVRLRRREESPVLSDLRPSASIP